MAKKTLNIGTTANDGQGDTLRDAAGKINDNFSELFAAAFDSAGGGSGYLTPENINTLLELNSIVGDATLVDSATIQARIDAGGGGASFTDLAGLNSNLSDATLVDSATIQARIDAAGGSFDSDNIDTLAKLNSIVGDATLSDSAEIQTRIDDATAGLTSFDSDNIDTLAKLNAILSPSGGMLIDTGDSRLTNSRDPNQHGNEAHSENFLDSTTVVPLINSAVTSGTAGLTSFDSTNISTLADLNAVANTTLVDSATIQARIDAGGTSSGNSNLVSYIEREIPDDRPIFIAAMGQSLIAPTPWSIGNLGEAVSKPTPTAKIKEWCSDGLGEETAKVNYAWRTLDIDKAVVQDDNDTDPGNFPDTGPGGLLDPPEGPALDDPGRKNGSLPYTGFTGGGSSNSVHGLAQAINDAFPDRDVYILNVSWSAHALVKYFHPFQPYVTYGNPPSQTRGTEGTADYFANNEGAGWETYTEQFDACIAGTNLPSTPDFFICQTGATDRTTLTELQFFEYYKDMDAELERSGRLSPSTPRVFTSYSVQSNFNEWNIWRTVHSLLDRPSTLLDLTYKTWDETHPTGSYGYLDGYKAAQKIIDFAPEPTSTPGTRVLRNIEKGYQTYADWFLAPNDTPPESITSMVQENSSGTKLYIPFKALDSAVGGNTVKTLIEQVEGWDVIRIIDNANANNYCDYAVGDDTGSWNSQHGATASDEPNNLEIEFVSKTPKTPGSWPPANNDKVIIKRMVTNLFGIAPAETGIKDAAEDTGGSSTGLPVIFRNKVSVEEAANVPQFDAYFIFGTNGTSNPFIYTPEENGDYERSIHISSVPQYDQTTGLLVPNRQANSGRYRLEARFDKDGLHDVVGGSFLDQTVVIAQPKVGNTTIEGTLRATSTITGRRITPTADHASNVIYSVKRDSVIRWIDGDLPTNLVGASSANYNEINPTNVVWTKSYVTLDAIGFLSSDWGLQCPANSDERWRWKLVVDFTFDEDI